jgi:hypothetical protein
VRHANNNNNKKRNEKLSRKLPQEFLFTFRAGERERERGKRMKMKMFARLKKMRLGGGRIFQESTVSVRR